jgi:hypothetical protein
VPGEKIGGVEMEGEGAKNQTKPWTGLSMIFGKALTSSA